MTTPLVQRAIGRLTTHAERLTTLAQRADTADLCGQLKDLANSVHDEIALLREAEAVAGSGEYFAGALNVIDLLRTGRDGKKYDYVTGHAGNSVNVSSLFAIPSRAGGGEVGETFTMREVVQALTQHYKDQSGDQRHVPATQMAFDTMQSLRKIIETNRDAALHGAGARGGENG